MKVESKQKRDERRRQRVGAIVKLKHDLPSAGFDPAVTSGTLGIVTEITHGDPSIEFELGNKSTTRPLLVYWDWVEVVD